MINFIFSLSDAQFLESEGGQRKLTLQFLVNCRITLLQTLTGLHFATLALHSQKVKSKFLFDVFFYSSDIQF